MAEFDNPYVDEDPFVRAHFDCPDCGDKLWEYAIQGRMVCEACRGVFPSEQVFDASIDQPSN